MPAPRSLTTITTRRLTLTATSASDATDLFPLMSDPSGWWFEPASRHAALDQTVQWLERSEARWSRGELSYWIVRRTADRALVGTGGAQRREAGYWNISWRISRHQQGQGYATELAEAAISAAREHDPLLPIVAWIVPTNTPSIRVAEKAGLSSQGLHLDPSDRLPRLAFADRPYPLAT